jgi:tellurite resistance protein TerC
LVAGLLAFDLGLLHRDKNHEIGVKESLLLTAFYQIQPPKARPRVK